VKQGGIQGKRILFCCFPSEKERMYKIQNSLELPELSVMLRLCKYDGSICRVILQVKFILKQHHVNPCVVYCRVVFLSRGGHAW